MDPSFSSQDSSPKFVQRPCCNTFIWDVLRPLIRIEMDWQCTFKGPSYISYSLRKVNLKMFLLHIIKGGWGNDRWC
jgi:hypothetical protein